MGIDMKTRVFTITLTMALSAAQAQGALFEGSYSLDGGEVIAFFADA